MSEITTYEKTKDSGIEWVGSVPSHWRVHTLYQLVTQVKEKNSNLQEKNLLSLSYGKIKRKDIDSPDGLLPASFDGYNIIEDGDIVLRLTDLQNDHTSLRVGLATERGIITSAYTTLRPIDTSNSKYLYYLLHAFDIKKGFYGMGSGVRQGLNYAEVKELRLVLPDQNEQSTIVGFLDEQCEQINSIIEDAKASIDEYKDWKAAVIFEAVTAGIQKDVPKKSCKIPFIEEFPSSWRILRLKDVATIVRGASPRPIEAYLTDDPGGLNWIKIGDTQKGKKYIKAVRQKIIRSGLSKTRFVHRGDLLLTNSMSFGEPYILDVDGCIHDGWVCISNIHDVQKEYLYYFLCSELCKAQFKLQVAGGVVQNLNVDKIGSTYILVPPISEQILVTDYLECKCSNIEKLIDEKQALIDELEQFKRSLIFETVTGKRKVV